jgi:8-oxo-dGTP pyrophosphatase MutT (NUDIX family)
MISRTGIEGFSPKFDVVSVFIEHDGEILLLHRQDHKPQGNTWSMPAGKVEEGEVLLDALVREVEEETRMRFDSQQYKYHGVYYVRYPEFDYRYHVYRLSIDKKPEIILNPEESKSFVWITPHEAFALDLIQHEDDVIIDCYGTDRPSNVEANEATS